MNNPAKSRRRVSTGPAPLVARICAGIFALGLISTLPEEITRRADWAGTAAIAQATSSAQASGRAIPDGALLGNLTIGNFPEAALNGKVINLGPGFRLYDLLNRIVVPASVNGRSFVVAYTIGPIGEVTQAWQLNDAEFAERQRLISARKASGSQSR